VASLAYQKEPERDVSSVEVEGVLSATAHELRLPLSHIKGFVSTLLRPDVAWDEDTKREFLAQIERETDRLSLLVEDLMEPTTAPHRRARSQQRTPRAPVALVAGGMDRVRGLLGSRSVEVDVPADLPMVEVDASAIERVIANLLHNALKYAPSDSHIRLAGRAIDGWLELSVEDDGPGIPTRHREQIFRRFFRGPAAQASGRPGSGLGLAICLSIVSAHGGRIWADARPGGGTRFTVVLPLAAADPLPDVSGRHHPGEATDRQREYQACRGPGWPNHRAVHRQYHLNSDSKPNTCS
jgi:two-component system sensor histidine kinase KdpD